MFLEPLYLKNLLIQPQALALDKIASSGGHLVRQVPQSAEGELQSGVYHSRHGFVLHYSQQLLWDGGHERRKHETEWSGRKRHLKAKKGRKQNAFVEMEATSCGGIDLNNISTSGHKFIN